VYRSVRRDLPADHRPTGSRARYQSDSLRTGGNTCWAIALRVHRLPWALIDGIGAGVDHGDRTAGTRS
jgi:hypothetical protein